MLAVAHSACWNMSLTFSETGVGWREGSHPSGRRPGLLAASKGKERAERASGSDLDRFTLDCWFEGDRRHLSHYQHPPQHSGQALTYAAPITA